MRTWLIEDPDITGLEPVSLYETIGEHPGTELFLASRRGVERPRRGVVLLGQHPELVGSLLRRPSLRFRNERAAHPTPLERLPDSDLVEEHFGAAAVESLQPVRREKATGCTLPAGDEEERVRVARNR
jgi:hypothetical protein